MKWILFKTINECKEVHIELYRISQYFATETRLMRSHARFLALFRNKLHNKWFVTQMTGIPVYCVIFHLPAQCVTFTRHHLWRCLSMAIILGLKTLATSDLRTFKMEYICDNPFSIKKWWPHTKMPHQNVTLNQAHHDHVCPSTYSIETRQLILSGVSLFSVAKHIWCFLHRYMTSIPTSCVHE